MNDIKYSVEDRGTDKIKQFPKELIKKVYDLDDKVLFGSRYIKGKVSYNYIPGEYTIDGIPFIIDVSIRYDNKGNADLPSDAVILPFKELRTMFPNNTFK